MCGRSSSFIAVNFSPSPQMGSTRRTTASALICPSQLRNSRWTPAPIALGPRVSMNRPPKLKSRTRATSSHPPQRQMTQTSSGILIRELSLREGGTVCFSMDSGFVAARASPAPRRWASRNRMSRTPCTPLAPRLPSTPVQTAQRNKQVKFQKYLHALKPLMFSESPAD